MTISGFPNKGNKRQHFDIYAIFEGPQELYLGHEVQVNVNLVEQVTLESPTGEKFKKCYLSPTKRRGVERRSLLWAPKETGDLLGDHLKCGIPKTCTKIECPICSVYGGLEPGKSTLIGRLTHGGGVAIQALDPEKKQRAMHPAKLLKKKGDADSSPMPFQRQYNEPGLLYPISNHLLSVTEQEFTAAAYAFLDSLARIGAGNPKGVRLHEYDQQPLLVVDSYLSPMGKRPVLSPHLCQANEAIEEFLRFTRSIHGKEYPQQGEVKLERFHRRFGDCALVYLQSCADAFVKKHLQG